MTLFRIIAHPRAAFAAVPTRALCIAGAVTLALGLASVTFARETHHISQNGRAFSSKEMSISVGDVVEFVNDDKYIHQIFIESPTFNFDSAEAAPGKPIDVTFSTPGTFEVRCHIHPKMHLVVTVK